MSMKKYLFSCVMLVAAVMTAGCSKDDDVKHPSALDDEELYAIIMPNDSQFVSYSMSDVVFTLSQIEAYDQGKGTYRRGVDPILPSRYDLLLFAWESVVQCPDQQQFLQHARSGPATAMVVY